MTLIKSVIIIYYLELIHLNLPQKTLRSINSKINNFFFVFSRATPEAYGDSQARGLIGVVATGLRQSHSNVGSEPRLQPTPQLKTPDP